MSDCTIQSHEWKLTIDEGTWAVGTPTCGPDCRFMMIGAMHPSIGGLGDEYEWAQMDPIPVSIRMATECPAYPTDDDQVPTGPAKPRGGYESGSHYIAHGTRCDCNWWPVIRPTPVASPEDVRIVAEAERDYMAGLLRPHSRLERAVQAKHRQAHPLPAPSVILQDDVEATLSEGGEPG